ncbi:MAG: hypothetical protein RID59_23780, partial [Hoeflea sp.]
CGVKFRYKAIFPEIGILEPALVSTRIDPLERRHGLGVRACARGHARCRASGNERSAGNKDEPGLSGGGEGHQVHCGSPVPA